MCPGRWFHVSENGAHVGSCRWADDYPDSWEPEDRLPQQLVAAWEEQQRERLLSSMHSASGSGGRGAHQAGSGRSQERREESGAGGAAHRNGVAARAGEQTMQGSAVGV